MTTTAGKSAELAVGDETKADVLGGVVEILQPEQVNEFVAAAIGNAGLENQRVCVVVPDGTRTCPLPLLLQAMREGLAVRINRHVAEGLTSRSWLDPVFPHEVVGFSVATSTSSPEFPAPR